MLFLQSRFFRLRWGNRSWFLQDFPGNLKISAHGLVGNDCFLTRPAVMRYLVDTPIRQDLLWKKQNGRKKQAGTLAS